MVAAARSDEVELVDAFLAQEKFLSGAPPEFGPRLRGKQGSLWDTTWPVADKAGIVENGNLRVNYAPASEKLFSIVLVFRQQCIYRLDFVAETVCHANPLWVRAIGIEPTVCGPHAHPWDVNRDHILGQNVWDLPCRVPLPQQIRRFDQAFPWFAEQVNLTLSPDDRSFDLPRELV